MNKLTSTALFAILLTAFTSNAQVTKVGSISNSRGASSGWTMDGYYMAATLSKLQNPTNFGPGGTVPGTFQFTHVSGAITPAVLSQLDLFFIGYVYDGTWNQSELDAFYDWVSTGGKMIITADSYNYDAVADRFGYSAGYASSNTNIVVPSQINHPAFNGPFGSLTTFYGNGSLGAFPNTTGATILAMDSYSNVVWIEKTVGLGKIVVLGDVDVMTTYGYGSGGSAINNDNDKAMANLFAYMAISCSVSLSGITSDVSCPGGSDGAIDLSLSGNYGNPTFAWTGPNGYSASSEDISGLADGNYAVIVTSSLGCSETESFVVGTTPDITPPVLLTQDISVTLANGTAAILPGDVIKESQWVAYITAFNLPAYNNGAYYGGVEQLSDVKTIVDANAGTVTLQPNFSKYASGDPEYINGAIGNKVIQASTYVEETGLVNQFFTFTGYVVSNTLAPGYDNYAFVRVFDQNFGILYEVRDPLIAGTDFSVAYSSTPAGAVYVQYGFGVDGLNANPADEAALGSVVVQAITTLGDNCGIASSTVTANSFDCSNLGLNTVTVTLTDVNGNSTVRTALVDVVGALASCSIASIPTNSTFTGGSATTLYLGYGAQSTTLSATSTGGSAWTYAWSGNTGLLSSTTSASPVFTPTSAGSYTYTVTSTNEFGCYTTCDITIDVVDARCGSSKNPKVLVCHNGNTICISPNAVPSHLSNHAGDNLGACTNKTDIVGSTAFNAYPNPSAGVVNLEIEILDDAELQIEVYNVTGQLVYAEKLNEKAGHYVHSIDLSSVSSGVYMIKMMNEGVVEIQRIQIQK